MNTLNRQAIQTFSKNNTIYSAPPVARTILGAVSALLVLGCATSVLAQSGPDAGAFRILISICMCLTSFNR